MRPSGDSRTGMPAGERRYSERFRAPLCGQLRRSGPYTKWLPVPALCGVVILLHLLFGSSHRPVRSVHVAPHLSMQGGLLRLPPKHTRGPSDAAASTVETVSSMALGTPILARPLTTVLRLWQTP